MVRTFDRLLGKLVEIRIISGSLSLTFEDKNEQRIFSCDFDHQALANFVINDPELYRVVGEFPLVKVLR